MLESEHTVEDHHDWLPEGLVLKRSRNGSLWLGHPASVGHTVAGPFKTEAEAYEWLAAQPPVEQPAP